MKSAAFMQWSGAEEGIRYGIHHLHQRASPGAKKKKNSCGAKWRPPLGRKNPDGLAVFSARWILAACGAAITPAAELLDLAVPFSQQASKAAAVDGRNRRKGRKFCVKKRLFDQKKVPCCSEEVFFFFSLFSLPPHPQQDHLSEITEQRPHWVKMDFSGAEKNNIYLHVWKEKKKGHLAWGCGL